MFPLKVSLLREDYDIWTKARAILETNYEIMLAIQNTLRQSRGIKTPKRGSERGKGALFEDPRMTRMSKKPEIINVTTNRYH